jgi:serine/threonine protein kinase
MEMAPEIVRRDYYSFGVDYWSAGVTLYAMVTGTVSRPIVYLVFLRLKFAAQHPWDDEEDVGLQILEDDIQFAPEDEVSDECKDFLRQMLKKNPAERLRIGLDMTSHAYFAGVYAFLI